MRRIDERKLQMLQRRDHLLRKLLVKAETRLESGAANHHQPSVSVPSLERIDHVMRPHVGISECLQDCEGLDSLCKTDVHTRANVARSNQTIQRFRFFQRYVRVKWDAVAMLIEDFAVARSEEHTSELQSHCNLVCRLLLE